tara:strand:- start:59 stop:466 length:408 start_codon:yes stop_codon:yes gene_type:complete
MMDEVYLYFRAQTTLTNDQDDNDSCCFPLSSFAGFQVSSATGRLILNMYFKSMKNYDGRDQADNTETISDVVALQLNASHNDLSMQKTIADITQKMNDAKYKKERFLVVADSLTGEFISDRLQIALSITIAAAHA